MSRVNQAWIWIAFLAVLGVLLYLAGSILLPFVAGMAVAYFLDPLADKLEKWGTSRTLATVLITLAFFAVVLSLLILLLPLLQNQILGLIRKLPALIDNLTGWLEPIRVQLEARLGSAQMAELKAASGGFSATAVKWLGGLLKGIWQGGLALFNIVSLLVVTPLVSFYLLRDWDRLTTTVDGWLPRRFAPEIHKVIDDIDRSLAGFVRGQGTVCLILATFYGIGLTVVGLDSGLLVGIGTGLISFIPYFGMLVGMATALAIALFQFTDWLPMAGVLAVFALGQVAEGMFLTPKLVGERVGLHPVWVIFALMAGGAGFGFTGLLLAVPVAATLGILIRHFLARYQESTLFDPAHDSAQGDPET